MNEDNNGSDQQLTADTELAIAACWLLVEAYEIGKRNGGSVDWQDVNDAWRLAREALGIKDEEQL